MGLRPLNIRPIVGIALLLLTMGVATSPAAGESERRPGEEPPLSQGTILKDDPRWDVDFTQNPARSDEGRRPLTIPDTVWWTDIPPRPVGARTGSAFMRSIEGLGLHAREAAVRAEVLSGNVPSFLRRAVMVELRFGKQRGAIAVMPDYLAIGSDEDFVRVPINPKTAQAIADAFGGRVPTKKIVDEVYRQAAVKLYPESMPSAIGATSTFLAHHQRIEAQRRGSVLGALTAGHKKDVINSRRAHQYPDRVCIYGWHRANHAAIQPLSTVHDLHHVDYSHGLRLMSNRVWVGDREFSVDEVLSAPSQSGLLSHEGTLPGRLP